MKRVKSEIQMIPCVACEGFEDMEFLEYTEDEGVTKEVWKCSNCNTVHKLYRIEDCK